MGDLLYDKWGINIHSFCELLVKDKDLWISYCPFLQNPLSASGCYLTKSVDEDSTKRKEVSNSVNSLDALNLFNRVWRTLEITELWIEFANADFHTDKWLKLAREAVTSYWLAVGVLNDISKFWNEFNTKSLYIKWYPTTNEYIIQDWTRIEISSWSKTDSNTRTKSCLLAWFTTVWFIIPKSIYEKRWWLPQISTNDYLVNKSIRNESTYIVLEMPHLENLIVSKPLNYDNLTKNSKALRENWQKLSREITMHYDNTIKNRRFALVYSLNKAFENWSSIDFKTLLSKLIKYKDEFVIDIDNFEEVMWLELPIADMCWLVYNINWNIITPITWVDNDVLTLWIPENIVDILDNNVIPYVCEVSL